MNPLIERKAMSLTNRKTVLTMEHIGKSFSGVRVLDDVNFDLKAGEVHVLAGENGAGKTTLIKILSGAHTSDEGRILLDGRAVSFKSPHDAVVRGISAIHQELALVGTMRVGDNIFLGREVFGRCGQVNFRSEWKEARKLLDQLGIRVDLEAPLSSYPLAVQQLVEIAKALVGKARILIMDEPTSALGDAEVTRLFELIARLKERGCAIIFITHRLEEIFRIGDRITVLRDGKLVGTSRAGDLTTDELIRWMVGREIRQQFPERVAHLGEVRLELDRFSLADPSGRKEFAVKDISLSARAGEILGIAGLRGSGKSELFNGLFGAYGRDVSGSVRLDGKPFRILSPRRSIDQGLALLTNDRKRTGLVSSLSLSRNITLASLRKFSPRGWIRSGEEADAASQKIREIDIRAASPDIEAGTLSGGNQQKVVLAKWLETEPRVLLLDEPTIGVDVGAKHEIYSLMNRLTAKGLTILLTTSELPELLAMSDRIVVLHRGRIQAELERSEATQEKVIGAAMGGESR